MIDSAKLRWRCRRGMLELDLLLQRFLQQGYSKLSEPDQEVFVSLLEHSDQTLHDWLLGLVPVTEKELVDVVNAIRNAT